MAYTGDINFSSVYNQSSLFVPRDARDTDGAWRDTDVRIVGPVVSRFQTLFLEMWNKDLPEEERIDTTASIPPIEVHGDRSTTIVPNGKRMLT